MKIDFHTPLVDIIIITFNQDNYINETIASAINQTYKNIRIIIADDCSTDNTRNIIQKWSTNHPEKITSVYNPSSKGITANSNAALRKSYGDYFLIIGGDDLLYSNRVESQIKWFKDNPEAVLCGHELDYIDENSLLINKHKSTKKVSGKGNIQWIRRGMLYGTISIMYKRTFNWNLEYDHRLPQVSDLKYCIDFLGDAGVYGFLDARLSAYRKTLWSYTVSNPEESLRDCNKMFAILANESDRKRLKDIKKGQIYLVVYCQGMIYLQQGNYYNSLQSFLKTITKNPFNWKAFLRIIQVVIKAISS